MSFEELFNQEITVASKVSETVADASGSVTVYTKDDMKRMGRYTINELAEITPGFSVHSTSDGDIWLETRGTYGDRNSKHLILVDGIPIHNSRNYMALTGHDLPLLFAKRVEFLKGPASALYGVSAFNGVINIISDDLEEESSKMTTKIIAGTENFKTNSDGTFMLEKGFLSHYMKKNKYGEAQISVGYSSRESDLQVISDNSLKSTNEQLATASANNEYITQATTEYTDPNSNSSYSLIQIDTTRKGQYAYTQSTAFIPTQDYVVLDTVSVSGYLTFNQSDVTSGKYTLSSFAAIDTIASGADTSFVIKDSIITRQSVRYSTTDSSLTEWREEFAGTENKIRNQEQNIFFSASQTFTQGLFEGVRLGLIFSDRETGYGMGWGDNSSIANNHTWSSFIPYISYKNQINDMVVLNSYAKYNQSREFGLQANRAGWWADGGGSTDDIITQGSAPKWGIFNYDVKAHNVEGMAEVSISFLEHASIISGINYDARWQDGNKSFTLASNQAANNSFGGGFSSLYDEVAHTYSGYIQARNKFPLLEGLITILGVRVDNGFLDGESYSTTSPRISLVQKITNEINIKTSLGRALKAPGIQEISHNKEKGIWIDQHNAQHPDKTEYTKLGTLTPEVIQTLEGGINFVNQSFKVGYTHFYNTTKDAIETFHFWKVHGKMSEGGHIDDVILESDFFGNASGTTHAQGGELEIQYVANKELRFISNGSFSETWGYPFISDNKTLRGYAPNAPIWKNNTGVGYENHWASGVLWFKYISGYRKTDGVRNGHYLFDMNINVPLSSYALLSLKVNNLLNKQYKSAPGTYMMPSRTISLGLTSEF